MMTIGHVWHFYGKDRIPPQLRVTPFELHEADLLALTVVYDVLLYRDEKRKCLVLALDVLGGRFHQR